MVEQFHIELLSNGCILITILSTDLTSAYWKELQRALSKLNRSNIDIYFDFLYRNGLENRFFAARLNNNSMLEGRLKVCDMSEKYKKIANMFFLSHMELLKGSALSNAHKD